MNSHMLLRKLSLTIAAFLTSFPALSADYVRYLGERETGCSGGKEIKDFKEFVAPKGKYFKNISLDPVGEIINRATNAGQIGCTIISTGVDDEGYIISAYLLAHADCGWYGGPTIQAYCKFSADLGDK